MKRREMMKPIKLISLAMSLTIYYFWLRFQYPERRRSFRLIRNANEKSQICYPKLNPHGVNYLRISVSFLNFLSLWILIVIQFFMFSRSVWSFCKAATESTMSKYLCALNEVSNSLETHFFSVWEENRWFGYKRIDSTRKASCWSPSIKERRKKSYNARCEK